MLDRVSEPVIEAGRLGAETLKKAKADLDAQGRFKKMRLWTIIVFALNTILVTGYVIAASGESAQIDASFSEGFPSSMVMIKNSFDQPIESVEIILDGQYTLQLATLAKGVSGFTVDRDFRAADGTTPTSKYVPRVVMVRAGGDVFEIKLKRIK